MPIICEATCTNAGHVIDPRQWAENITRKEIDTVKNTLTDPDPKAVVLETHWTPYSPCPVCGVIGWTNLKYTRYVKDKNTQGDVTSA